MTQSSGEGHGAAAHPVAARVLAEGRMDLVAVRTKAVTELNRVNAQLVQVQCGHLVAVPISRRAREPGALSDFLLDIGLDPFGHWNTLYYAADPEGAKVMDALAFGPEAEGLFEAEFTAVIERARADWETFLADPASFDEPTLRSYRAALAAALRDLAGVLQDRAYAGKAHRWMHFFGMAPRDPAAPPAPRPAGLPPSPARRASAPRAADPAPAPGGFEAARARHEARLAALRRQLGSDAAVDLVPVALCPGAIVPGPMADWLLAIGADPFGTWNIVLRPGDEAAAQALGLPRPDVADDGRFEAEAAALVSGLMAVWSAFARGPEGGDPARAEAMRGYLREALAAGTAHWRAALAGAGALNRQEPGAG
jgi:hypothetical protein